MSYIYLNKMPDCQSPDSRTPRVLVSPAPRHNETVSSDVFPEPLEHDILVEDTSIEVKKPSIVVSSAFVVGISVSLTVISAGILLLT